MFGRRVAVTEIDLDIDASSITERGLGDPGEEQV